MNDFEQILARLADLEKQVAQLKVERSAAEKAVDYEALPLDSVVGKDYVAYRFGCSKRAVVRKEAGTGAIRRVSLKPLKFIKRDVDAAFWAKTTPAKVLAAKFANDARPVRKKSVVKKAGASI